MGIQNNFAKETLKHYKKQNSLLGYAKFINNPLQRDETKCGFLLHAKTSEF